MGQHRIQRQLLQNFSFPGPQTNSQHTWCLNKGGYRPESRSVDRVGFFEVGCSEAVDDYITKLEDGFKTTLERFSRGEFTYSGMGRETFDFIAVHYVRSQACRRQIEHVVGECNRNLGLAQPQAEAEYKRLTSHQDVSVFEDLVDGVSRTLTNYTMYPAVFTGPLTFVTSDKVMYSGMVESCEKETLVWFPLTPSTGLALMSDGHAGQILGPHMVVNQQLGRINFAKLPEAPILRCQPPEPTEGNEDFVNQFNGMMVQGSTQLYAANRNDIDVALRHANSPTGYRYQPTPSPACTTDT